MPIIDAYPDPFIPPSTTSRWNLIFDVLPPSTIDYDIWQPRVRVGATEIPVVSGLTVDDSDLSRTASFSLTNIADVSLFTSSAQVDVGIGKKVSSAWDEPSMIWEIVDGYVESLNENRSGTPQDPGDAVSVVIASKSDSKLNKTSEAGLIIYDSNRTTISDDELKPIKDANGNTFTPVVVAIPGLKVSHLFQRVFVTECGFDSYETDLPEAEWPIQRYSVGMGQRFYDGLRSILGVYNAVVKLTDTTIGIYDSYKALPSGVPVGKAITVDNAEQIGTSRQNSKLDALMVQFAGIENNYDFTTPRFEYPSETSGTTKIDYERIVIEFRKITSPTSNVIVREALNIENKTTSISGLAIEESSEQYLFTASGEVGARIKTVNSRLPQLPVVTLDLQRSREERESFGYTVHPYKARSIYCSRRSQTISGLVTNDADNPNISGDPAKQEAAIAYRSNNMAAGQTYTYESLGSRIETAVPQKDGTVLVRVLQSDDLNPINSVDYWEKRPGDIGVSGVAQTQEQMPVFADDVVARTADRIDDFPVGELPLKFALPLARRALNFKREKGRTLNLTHIGYDTQIVVGGLIAAYDRAGTVIGNFLVEGRRVVCDRGLVIQITGREVADTAADFANLGPSTNSIASGGQQTWTVPIYCETGFSLSTGPAAVSNIAIEARHVETPSLGWTDLETTDIDLSAWNGTTQSFEFRFTAASVAAPTRVQFEILVRQWFDDPLISFNLSKSTDSPNTEDSISTVAIDTTGAKLLVAFVSRWSSGTLSSFTDSEGNTWTPLTEQLGGSCRLHSYYCINPTTSSAHTVNAAGTNLYASVALLAFKSIAALDASNGNGAIDVTSLSTGSVTPLNANALIVTGLGFTDLALVGDASIDSGFALIDSLSNSSIYSVAAAYKILPIPSAVNPTWSTPNVSTKRMATEIVAFS